MAETTPAGSGARAGWYRQGDTRRYWDGERWTESYAPLESPAVKATELAAMIIWALSLGFGVAGVLAWDAPALAYYWPLGFGGAGVALALIGYATNRSEVPLWALIALLASIGSIAIGVAGHSQLEDARTELDEAQESFNAFP
jgi:Protein of unknown function (DUF2510)